MSNTSKKSDTSRVLTRRQNLQKIELLAAIAVNLHNEKVYILCPDYLSPSLYKHLKKAKIESELKKRCLVRPPYNQLALNAGTSLAQANAEVEEFAIDMVFKGIIPEH